MMNRGSVAVCIIVLSAIFTLGFLTVASADVINIDNFAVTRDGTPLFNDSFGAGLTLAGGNPLVQFYRRERIFLMASRRTTSS